jgi:hypothetical protein
MFSISNLKTASYQQLKLISVISDYVFCSLLSTSRLAYLDPTKVEQDQKMKVEKVLFYQGLVIASFASTAPGKKEILLKIFDAFDSE